MKTGDTYIKKRNKVKFKIVRLVDKDTNVIYHEVGFLNHRIQPTKDFLEQFDFEVAAPTKEELIIQILRNHERTTFPNGVGSVFRCVESDSFHSIAKQILNIKP